MILAHVPECEGLDLKPCPFCGGSRMIIRGEEHSDGRTWEWVECASTACEAAGPPARRVTKGHTIAIGYWNRRSGE